MFAASPRILFLGASVGVHVAIAGAVLAVQRTEPPAPLPVVQVDLVQESAGAYRRALAKTLPSIESRVARTSGEARRASTLSVRVPRAPEKVVRQAALEPAKPAAPIDPAQTLRDQPVTAVVLDAAPLLMQVARAAVEDATPPEPASARSTPVPLSEFARPVSPPLNVIRQVRVDTTPHPEEARRAVSKDARTNQVVVAAVPPDVFKTDPHPEEARRAVSTDARKNLMLPTPARQAILESRPHPEEARSAVSKDAVLVRGRAILVEAAAPATRSDETDAGTTEDSRAVATVSASPHIDQAREPNRPQVIAAVDSAVQSDVTPPRRKPDPPARIARLDKTPQPPGRKPPRSVEAVEVKTTPEPKDEPPRLASASEVAEVLETLKPKPALEPVENVAFPAAQISAAPEGATGDGANETPPAPILAVAATAADATQDRGSAPAFEGEALGNAPPRYPNAARLRGIEGEVLLRVVVLPSGKAADVTISSSSGSPLLDRAASNAVRRWRFRPARRGGQTVVGWVDVPVSFRLTN